MYVRKGERMRKSTPINWFTVQMPTMMGMGLAEVGNLELKPGLSSEWRRSNNFSLYYYLPGAASAAN